MNEITVEELAESAGIEAMGRAVLVFAENERLKAQLGEAVDALGWVDDIFGVDTKERYPEYMGDLALMVAVSVNVRDTLAGLEKDG